MVHFGLAVILHSCHLLYDRLICLHHHCFAFWALYVVILYYSYSCSSSIENRIIGIHILLGLAIVVVVAESKILLNIGTRPFITRRDLMIHTQMCVRHFRMAFSLLGGTSIVRATTMTTIV
jgi:hypothetical protein